MSQSSHPCRTNRVVFLWLLCSSKLLFVAYKKWCSLSLYFVFFNRLLLSLSVCTLGSEVHPSNFGHPWNCCNLSSRYSAPAQCVKAHTAAMEIRRRRQKRLNRWWRWNMGGRARHVEVGRVCCMDCPKKPSPDGTGWRKPKKTPSGDVVGPVALMMLMSDCRVAGRLAIVIVDRHDWFCCWHSTTTVLPQCCRRNSLTTALVHTSVRS